MGSAAIALPFLDAMTPAFAASSMPGGAPVRMAFFYVPNGMIMDAWNPGYEGKFQEMPRSLKPLEPFKDDILQIGNLTHNTGRALLDGAGDHGRCCGSYLTGVQVKKSLTEIKSSISFDQIVANEIGKQTGSRRSNWAWKTRARRGIAIAVIPARIPTIWHGAANRSRFPLCSIPGLCSNACSAPVSP